MGDDKLTTAYFELQTTLHRVALSMLKDDEDANDALQDTFCRMWSAERVQSDSEARYKLIAVLRNVCINKLRNKKHYCRASEELDMEATPEEYSDDTAFLRKRLLKELSPLQRQIFELAVFEDYEYSTIALRLGMTVEAVRMNMSRARRKMLEAYKRIER